LQELVLRKFVVIYVLLALSSTVLFGTVTTTATTATTATAEGVLGLKGVFNILSSWITNGYAPKIFALICFAVGLQKAFTGHILQFFLMLGLAVLISQGDVIISKITADIKACTYEKQVAGHCGQP